MVTTHCLPNGSLATGELPVPNIPYGVAPIDPGAGNRRGVVPFFSGLDASSPDNPPGVTDPNSALVSNFVADGWVFMPTVIPGEDYVTSEGAGILNLLNNDPNHGLLYQNALLHWWGHMVKYLQGLYGASIPIIPAGASWGGFSALTIAQQATSTITAYAASIPAQQIWSVNPVIGVTFTGTPNFSTTVAAGSNGVTLPQASLFVAALPTAPGLVVVNAASQGWQIVYYSGTSTSGGNHLTGCVGGIGAGTINTGDSVFISPFTSGMDLPLTGLNALAHGQGGVTPVGLVGWRNGDTLVGNGPAIAVVANAITASQPVSEYNLPGQHQFGNDDISFMVAQPWVSGGTYALNRIVTNAGASYLCILAVSGSTTAPGSDATHWSAVTNGTTSTSWFHSTVDPLCPAIF